MNAIGFYLFYTINWIITLLPLQILYIFSDILYLFLFYVISYRRKVVLQNLRNAFPDKSDRDIRTLEKKYYRHLADLMIEILKMTHMSPEQLKRRMRVTNPGQFIKLRKEKQNIIAVLGHYNNWEWLQSIQLYTGFNLISIYKPLQNKYFDMFLRKLREKNGMKVTPMSMVVREVVRLRGSDNKYIYAFLTDQTPARSEIRYWTKFLNQDTPVYLGAEKIASKYDMPVVFFYVEKLKRGFYQITMELLFEHCSGLSEHTITEAHTRRLEEAIRERPEYWIWSHRRWKHKRPDSSE